MLQLQQLQDKITSARHLQSVVDTMRGLAAVNIRRAEQAADQGGHYARTIHLALNVALQNLSAGATVLPGESSGNGRGALAAVIVTTDQGLCGQFNDRIISYAHDWLERDAAAHGGDQRLIVTGLKGYERLDDAGKNIIDYIDAPSSVETIPGTVRRAFTTIESLLTSGDIQRLVVIYNRLHHASSFVEGHLMLVPFNPRRFTRLPTDETPWTSLPTSSVPADQLLPILVRHHVYIDLYQAYTQSFAAENAARLSSMQNASDNIKEKLEELEATYRRVRQDVITNELMDLMGGVQAVN